MNQTTKFISVKALIGGKIKEKFFRSGELGNLHLIDPAFFLAMLKERKTVNPFSDTELKNYCRAVLQNTFYVILRRYPKIKEEDFLNICGEEVFVFREAWEKLTADSWQMPSSAAEAVIWLYNELKNKAVMETGVPARISLRAKRSLDGAFLGWRKRTIDCFVKTLGRWADYFIERAYLQGSFATADYLPDWSDLDVIVFLKEEVFASPENLLVFKKQIGKVSMLVYKIDPLVHHEIMIFTEFDREHYPVHIFPPILYDYCRTIFGDENFTISPRLEVGERIYPLMKFIDSFRKRAAQGKVSADDYSWKNDLSLIMLFPALLLEAVGVEVYKKFSFDKAKERFPNLDFSVVDEASAIREKWRRKNFLRFCPNFILMAYPGFSRRLVNLHRRLFSGASITLAERARRQKIYRDFITLGESAIDEILKKNNE